MNVTAATEDEPIDLNFRILKSKEPAPAPAPAPDESEDEDEKPICEECFCEMMEQMTGNGVGYENGYYQCDPLSQHEIENCSIKNINYCKNHFLKTKD
tara:strand:+ start:430 stop:723 length:294 start_codon:yes stop_codon:yes gene_type:complete